MIPGLSPEIQRDLILSVGTHRARRRLSPIEVVKTFNEIEEIINEELKIDISNSVQFYEFISEYQMLSDKNPRIVLENINGLMELSNIITSMIGIEVSPFGLRFGSKGILPHQVEWFDLRVEPLIKRADDQYFFSIVYRSRDENNVKEFLRSLEDTQLKIQSLLEKDVT